MATSAPAAATSIVSTRRGFWAFQVFNLVVFIGMLAFGLDYRGIYGYVPSVLAMVLMPFIWSSASYVPRSGPRGVLPKLTAPLLWTYATVFVLGFAMVLAFGWSVGDALRCGSGLVVQTVVGQLAYRWLRSVLPHPPPEDDGVELGGGWRQSWREEWTPTQPTDVAALLVAAVVAAVAVTPIGTSPGVWVGGTSLESLAAMWTLSTVTVGAGSACLLILFPAYTSEEVRAVPPQVLAPLVLLSFGSLWVIYHADQTTIAWLLLLPPLVAGMLLRPWGAAAHTLALMIAAASLGTDRSFGRVLGSRLNIELSIDTLLVVCTLVALTLSMLQQQLRQQRAEWHEQAGLLETILQSMGDGVVLGSRGGEVRFRNEAARRLLGPDLDRPGEKSWSERFGAHWLDGTPAVDPVLLPSDGGTTNTVLLGGSARSDAGTRTVTVTTRRVVRRGETRLLVLLRDVEAQLEREDAMRGFAATAAHDLKRPLTATHGWLEMAREMLDAGDALGCVTALDKALCGSQRMRSTIDDWLDYSLIREGRAAPERVELAPLVEELVATLSLPGETRLDGVGPTIAHTVRHDVVADPALTRQLLTNLIGNALKYTAPGVHPSVRIHSRSDGGHVLVTVRDNGIGIPEGSEELIFEAFHRASHVRESYDGSGVGLAVCRTIVEKQGGRIWATRLAQGGSEFAFTLPAARGPEIGAEVTDHGYVPPQPVS